MEAALLSGDGSRLPIASRNRCRVDDLQTYQTTSAEEFEKRMVLDSQVCLPPRTIVESTFVL